MSRDRRLAGIEKDHPRLSVRRQCSLLSLTRSTLYATPAGESAENLVLMRLIDEQFLETPWYGSRQIDGPPFWWTGVYADCRSACSGVLSPRAEWIRRRFSSPR